MTAMVAAAAVALAVILGSGFMRIGEASAQRTRAQIAADAAALAAVAESAPYGRGHQAAVARRYAALNGARLIECRCEPGATAVQVEVEVGRVRARARAVLDPDLLRPASIGFDGDGLHPQLRAAVNELLAEAPGSLRVTSGYRSPAGQAALWSEALARYGSAEAADDWVARPGHSMHEKGLAVDLSGDISLAVRLIEQLDLPLHRPLENEPWHFELVGSRR